MTRTVTDTLFHADGSPWADATVTFVRDRGSYTTAEAYPPDTVTATTDEDGTYSVDLWPNAAGYVRASYRVIYPDNDRFSISIPAGSTPITMAELRALTSTGSLPTPSALAAHEAAADPHPQYLLAAETDLLYAPISHVSDHTNPHAVTAAQVGAYTTGQADVLLALKAPLASPALTGVPTAPTAATPTNTTQIATTAFVQAVVAALVASSPAALDTLNELAAALGNDPNFATIITTALAGKAPLVSPALTGTPTAPTAGSGTNTTQLATTAFVKAALDLIVPQGATVDNATIEIIANALRVKDTGITPPKIAAAALPSGELNPDPRFTIFTTVSTAAFMGKRRFYSGTGGATISGGQMTLTLGTPATGQEGAKIWGSEAGFIGGQTISVQIKAIVPATATVAAALAGRQSDGVTLAGTASAGTQTPGTGSEQPFLLEGYQLNAAAAAVDAYLYLSSGTGTVVITEISVVKGAKYIIGNPAASITAGALALLQIQGTLSTDADLTTRLTRQVRAGEDPFSRFFPPTSHYQDGSSVLRWQQGGGSAAVIENDTSNPFGLTTFRITPTYGRRYQLSELPESSTGQLYSFGALVRIPIGNTFAINYAFRNAAGGSTGAASGTATAGDGTVQWLFKTGATIPANSVAVDEYFTRSVGTGAVDVYGVFAVPGASISREEALSLAYSQRYDPGAWLMRHQSPEPVLNTAHLFGWHTVQSQLAQGAAATYAHLVLIGDSIPAAPYRYAKPLAARLAADTPAGQQSGPGFVSALQANYQKLNNDSWPKLGTVTRTGTWAEVSGSGNGPDLCEATSSTATSTQVIPFTGTDATILYLKKSGGGDLRWRVDAGSWTTVPTANASNALGSIVIPTQTVGVHTITVEVVSGSVTYLGTIARDLSVNNGLCFYVVALAGTKTADWVAKSSSQVWRDAIALMTPNLVNVALGTNDAISSGDGDVPYKANLLTFISDLRVAVTNVDVFLDSPYEFATAHVYDIPSLANRVREIAMTVARCACMNWHRFIPAYDAADFEDNTHPNATGGQLLADAKYRALKR